MKMLLEGLFGVIFLIAGFYFATLECTFTAITGCLVGFIGGCILCVNALVEWISPDDLP